MKTNYITLIIALAATLPGACSQEEPGTGTSPDLYRIAQVDVIAPASPVLQGGGGTRSVTDGAVITAFAAGDQIRIFGFRGEETVYSILTATDPEGNGTLQWTLEPELYINITGNSYVTANYSPGNNDIQPADQGYSTYPDRLQARAELADGTIIPTHATPGVSPAARLRLEFTHNCSLVRIATLKDPGGADIDLAGIEDITLYLTDVGSQAHKVAIPLMGAATGRVIVPSGARLTSIAITPRYQPAITVTFAGEGLYTRANFSYPLNITLHPNRATVEVDNITPWGEEEPANIIPTGYDYAVYTPADLIALADAVNKTNGSDGNLPGTTIPAASARIIQMADIDMPAGTDWVPIGIATTNDLSFSGTYNGNGCTITNLRTADDYRGNAAGLFGRVEGTNSQDAVLTSIHLRGCNITDIYTTGYVGALAGYTAYAVISGCSATGSVEGYFRTGGLIGFAGSDTYLTRSRSNCTVTDKGGENCYAGGLVATTYCSYIVVCTAAGQVTGLRNAGGLMGRNESATTIAFCYATGNATAQDQSAGWAAGFITYNARGTIRNCYATGTPSGTIASAFAVTCEYTFNCHPYVTNPPATPGATVRTAYSLANIKTVRTTGTTIEVIRHTFTQANAWASATDDYPTLNYGIQ